MKKNYHPYNTLTELFEDAFCKWRRRPLSRFVDGKHAFSYQSFEHEVKHLVTMLDQFHVGSGDRVAILSENMPNWGVVFCAAVITGRVAVPIFHGSSSVEIGNILAHSNAKALFVSTKLKNKIPKEVIESLSLTIELDDFSILYGQPMPPTSSSISESERGPDSLAVIVYTSGTTSARSKGVMLSHRNLCHSVWAAFQVQPVNSSDRWLSIMPLGHVYELALGLLLPVSVGGSIVYLQDVPTPAILLPAMKAVRPTVMLAVPLVIEKVCRKMNRWKASHPGLSRIQRRFPMLADTLVGIRLWAETGGKLKYVGIGGAKMLPEIETFLQRIRFPYGVVYGMTETSPLICMAPVGKNKLGYVGTPICGMTVRLGPADPKTGETEILVKGPNIMLGYYRDPEQTSAIIDSDGWLHTGDLGIRDEAGQYAVVGRTKNIILGSSGENVYPEDIELIINSFPGISDSLVVPRGNRLVALVYSEEGIPSLSPALERSILDYVNERVNSASRISCIELMHEPFQKSVTAKIRRFLYH